jgi:hypothetical protein
MRDTERPLTKSVCPCEHNDGTVGYSPQDLPQFSAIVNTVFHQLRTPLGIIHTDTILLSENYYDRLSVEKRVQLVLSMRDEAIKLRECLGNIDTVLPLPLYVSPNTVEFCIYLLNTLKQELTVKLDNLQERTTSLARTVEVLMEPPTNIMPLSRFEFFLLMRFVEKEVELAKQKFDELMFFFSWD